MALKMTKAHESKLLRVEIKYTNNGVKFIKDPNGNLMVDSSVEPDLLSGDKIITINGTPFTDETQLKNAKDALLLVERYVGPHAQFIRLCKTFVTEYNDSDKLFDYKFKLRCPEGHKLSDKDET